MSTWLTFVPYRSDWGGAAWIEIDRHAIAERFVSSDDLVRRWKDGAHYQHTIMPRIECACIGEVPVSAFKSVFITWSDGSEIRDISIDNRHEDRHRKILAEWQESMRQGTAG